MRSKSRIRLTKIRSVKKCVVVFHFHVSKVSASDHFLDLTPQSAHCVRELISRRSCRRWAGTRRTTRRMRRTAPTTSPRWTTSPSTCTRIRRWRRLSANWSARNKRPSCVSIFSAALFRSLRGIFALPPFLLHLACFVDLTDESRGGGGNLGS